MAVFAFDTTSGAPKTGDAANITLYVDKDWASVNALTDTSATEIDSTNAKGWYLFDVSQTETNANTLLFTGKSTTANISIVGQLIYTVPANFTTLSIDSSGRALSDVDTIKTNPVVNGGTITFPTTATLASTTNITAGTITTVTNLTNAATNGDLTTTMKASVNVEADTALADYDAPTHAELTSELATADDATLAAIAALSIPTAVQNADALLDRSNAVETGVTPRGALRIMGSVLGGKLSGAGTNTETFRNTVADSKDRVTATVDTSGNRTAITIDQT